MQKESKMETVTANSKNDCHTIEAINGPIFQGECVKLARKIKESGRKYITIYPVPKNGMYVAHNLLKMTGISVSEEYPTNYRPDEVLVVDDIIDSGKTLQPFIEAGHDTAVLFTRPQHTKKVTFYGKVSKNWIKFPWEKEDDIEKHLTRILEYIGEDPGREGLLDTPKRVVRSWTKLFGGYKMKAEDILATTFSDCGNYDEMVLLRDIPFYSTCEHHMLPFYGIAHVGYLPKGKVVGLSKLARLVEMHARRLQIQEKMTSDIAADINRILKPKGVAVMIEAQHLCMQARGVEKHSSTMVTSKMTGAFLKNETSRNEFLKLVGK